MLLPCWVASSNPIVAYWNLLCLFLNVSEAQFLCCFQELAKKQSIDDAVRAAAAKAAPIEEFPSFLKYDRNGECVYHSGSC